MMTGLLVESTPAIPSYTKRGAAELKDPSYFAAEKAKTRGDTSCCNPVQPVLVACR